MKKMDITAIKKLDSIKMKKIDIIALILLIIGGINWGLYGLLSFNILDFVFGGIWIDKIIYFLVGISGIYAIVAWKHFFCPKHK